MWNPESFRALLSELEEVEGEGKLILLPSSSIPYNSLNNARNDPRMHMEQREETLRK